MGTTDRVSENIQQAALQWKVEYRSERYPYTENCLIIEGPSKVENMGKNYRHVASLIQRHWLIVYFPTCKALTV